MERSSRFISLSGLSGVAAGTVALIGGIFAITMLAKDSHNLLGALFTPFSGEIFPKIFSLALLILFVAICVAAFFTIRKSKQNGHKIWTSATKQLLIHLMIPLIIGGAACMALVYHEQIQLVAPATLIFYGLALMNASKYTYNEIYYLGLIESLLGICSCFFLKYGLLLWMLGFGLLHIAYGFFMHNKYR